MKGKAKVFRLLLIMVLTLTMVFVVAACKKNTDEADVAEAKEALVIGYTGSDNENSVTQKLTLPTSGLKEVTITWTTSHPAVVTQTGDVTRPVVDTIVTLTATLTKGEEVDTKEFLVKVIKAPEVTTPQEALDALEITGEDIEEDDGIYSTTKDIVLPTTSLGLAVNWESSSTAIAINGTVTRPEYGENTARVILTAYIGSLEKEFIVDVLAITTMPIADVLSSAHTQLILASNEVVEDITLPAAVIVEGIYNELYNTGVTWVSSNTDFITNDGKVTRPALEEPDVMVTLTATITFENQTTTKAIQIRVLADSEHYEEFDTFLEAQEYYLDDIDGEADRRYVKIFNVSLIGRMEDGLMFVDSEGSIFFAFGSNSNAYRNAEQGKLYDVIGNLAYYFGLIQINGTGSAFSRQPTILIEKDGDPVTVEPTVVESLVDLLPETMPTLSLDNMMQMEYLTLDAKVYIQSTTDNYGVFLVDVNYDGDYSDIDAQQSPKVPYNNNSVVVYYTSNKDVLIPLNGLTVTIDVVLYGLRDDRNIYNVAFLGELEDISIHEMTDAQAVAAVKQTLEMTTPTTIVSATTIDLPTELLGTTIAWVSSDEEVIALDGTVTPVDGARVEVELTATITIGEEEEVLKISVMVGELPLSTVEEVLELESGDPLLVKGTVVGYSANNTLVLHDETGAIAVFVGGSITSEDNANALKGAIGRVVIIEGSRTAYQGLEQVQNIVKVEVLTETPVTLKQDITELEWTAEALKEHQSKLVSIVDGTVTNVSVDEHNNVAVTITLGEKSIVIRWDSRVAITGGANVLATAEEGDIINVIDAPLGWNSSNPQIGYYVSGQVTLEADPSLERFDVVFMDGEEVVDTIEVVEGRTILEFPTMIKEGFAFAGWFKDDELTEPWLEDDVVEDDITLYAKWAELEVLKVIDLGTAPVTGYGANTYEVNGVSIPNDRVQINVSSNAPHTDMGAFLVFAPINSATTAWAIFDLSGGEYATVSTIEFELSTWSGTAFDNIIGLEDPRLVVQGLNSGVWETLGTFDLKETLVKNEYVTVSVHTTLGATQYRFSYIAEDAASGNTTQALTLDNVTLLGVERELENPVEVTFDLGYGDSEPVVVTIESGESVLEPTQPSRVGYTFLGWFVQDEETPFDFEASITEDMVLIAGWEEMPLMSIADAAASEVGTWVKFVGVVTGFTDFNPSYGNRNNTYIQDETGAILLYQATIEDLEIGDVYEVVGQLAAFNGLLQIASGATYTLSDEEIEIPEPVEITDLTEIDVTLQSQKVSFEAVVKSVSANGQELVVTLGEEDITIRSNSNSASNEINTHFLTAEEGQPVSVVGVYVGWFNRPQLVPYSVEEVVFIELTDLGRLNMAKDSIEEALDGKSFNMGTALPMPALENIEILSQVTDPAGAIIEGVLADVTEDTEVTLTLTLKSGAEELVVEVTFTVLFVDPDAPVEPVEVTAAYVGATGNMTAGNNATTIGLDDSIFVVTSIERSPNPLHVGLNQAGQIRLYNAADSGSTLVISIADGYTITKVEFVFGGTVTSAKIMTGTDVQLEGELTSNSTISYDELNVDTFSIQNIGTKQIYILQIKITYIQS